LRRNAHLDEKILGDIQTYRWPVPRFDAVVCGDVPEHLPRPTAALDNLFDAVKPGGDRGARVPEPVLAEGIGDEAHALFRPRLVLPAHG